MPDQKWTTWQWTVCLFNKKNQQQFFKPLGSWGGFLHWGAEEGIAEEMQGSTEDHTSVVSGLQASNQEGVLSNCMRVLWYNSEWERE